MPHASHTDSLPELLTFLDGSPVVSAEDWARRRAEIAAQIIPLEYGGMPPDISSDALSLERISESQGAPRVKLKGAMYRMYRATIQGGTQPFSFDLQVWTPTGEGPFPVVIYGDGCWSYLTDEVINDVLGKGFALVAFNRCEFARDRDQARDCGIYASFPGEYGALAAWAWSYHRAIDAVIQIPFMDAQKIAITGHSRGGKTVLLAAATDPRIAVVSDNDSGCGGSGSFHIESDVCETIRDITGYFPYWFGKEFHTWAEREAALPFDQHFLKALIAPRAILSQFALDDAWANHPGTIATHEAAHKVYQFLGAENRIALSFRPGIHKHMREDWNRFLDFAQSILQ